MPDVFGTVPSDKFVDGMTVRFLRTGCAERLKNRILRLFQIRQSKDCFCLAAFRCLPICHTGGFLAALVWRFSWRLMFSKPVYGPVITFSVCPTGWRT